MAGRTQLHGFSLIRLLIWSAAIIPPCVGVIVMVGWIRTLPSLTSMVPGLPKMSPNSALGLILGGMALGLLHALTPGRLRRAAGLVAAWGLILIGAATLLQLLSGRDLGVQVLLFRWTDWASRTPPHLTSANTAACFVLLGSALLLLGRRAPTSPKWATTLVLLAFIGALRALNGYIHGALRFADAPQLIPFIGMGLHTSLAILLLGVGILCARPEEGLVGLLTRDTLGGFLARRLVPVGLLGPLLADGALELLHRAGLISELAKAPLFSTVMSLGGVALVFLAAVALNRIDTERRQANAALEASEARYRGLLESAPDAVVTADRFGRIIFINAQAERVFGYPREELLGQKVEVLVPERLREAHRRQREAYVAAPTIRKMGQGLALRGLRKDGSELPLDISLSPLQSQDGLSVTTIIRDVTEREQYLERLNAARTEAERERVLLQTVVDSAPVGILFVDPLKDEVRLNSALQALMGEPMESPAGRRQYLGRLRHTDGRPVSFEELPSTRALAGEEVPPEEYLVQNPDRRIPVLTSAAPVRWANGEVRGVVVSIQDISARQELERLRQEYVGLITHDLRTPLQNITLRTQLLQRALKQKGLSKEATTAEALLRNARQMKEMVEELLESSRLEAGQVELHREPMDLVRFLEEVVERDVPPDERERLRLEVSTPVPWVPVDAPRLERVVVNLLTNALKYGTPGTPVVVRLEQQGAQLQVSVRDQGPGLKPEELPRLFTKFYRTQSGRSAQGVGLGLYISRLIIEAHGGRISVQSTAGQGSTFTFTLPVVPPHAREERAEPR
ncbi:sensor histidine kinase [Hyalangium rubrum]|uniref:histidine kinase n=1 Tax=Hyalangium rubrum TaxID=3103134 RepID=A0ABU5H1R6_9BACT|nr:PAS domain S-box protein [Hyalangium sp. s54d21]MDY7226708.1 PAS domain S-box protein [Hyalangium sp. s54d21]